VENFKNGLSSHLVGQKPTKIIMEKYILCTLATFQFVGSFREVAKVLEVDRRNVKKATQRRILLDTSRFAF
jgi:hypothetical protein